MSEIPEERENVIRQSEDYQKTRKILASMYYNITALRRTIDLTQPLPFAERYDFHPHYADFKQNCLEFKQKWDEAQSAARILRGMKLTDYSSLERESMSKMFAYLGLVESLGVALADMVLLLLMANDRVVHTRGPVPKHATKAKDLEEVDLAYKLDFLKEQELDIFAKVINKDVRNHIAHLKFTIQSDGAIRKRDNSPIDIDGNISSFWESVDTLKLVFEDIGLLQWMERMSNEENRKPV